MLEYKTISLGEISLKIGSGSTPRGGQASYKNSGISLIRSLNVHNFNFKYNNLAFIDEKQALKLKNVTVEKDDILLNITGASVARCCMVPEDVIPARVNQHVAIIRINKKVANPKYILFVINSSSYKNGLLNLSETGATREALTKSDISNYKIPLPDIKQQNRIAQILDNYGQLIVNNTKRIAILEQMTEQLYKEWFVRMRFPDYQNTKFNKGIPEEWRIKKIGDVFKTASGGTPSRKNEHYYNNGSINWLKTGELKNTFTSESEEKITIEGLNGSSAKIFPKGTVVIAMYCAMPYISILTQESSTNQACCAFLKKSNSEDYGSYYTYHLIKGAQYHLVQFAHGAAQQNLSQESIKSYGLIVANIDIVNKFNKTIEPIYDEIRNLNAQIQNLRKTRDLLLPRLISGKFKVQIEVEKQVEIQKPITAFYQKQILAHIIKKQEEHQVPQGEMVLAKNTYLIDKIFNINTGFNWKNWHYGTYDGKIRTLINGRDRFFAKQEVGNSGYKVIVLGENKDKVLDAKYHYPELDKVDEAMDELLAIYAKYTREERSHKIELLNTTCKAIADTQSVDEVTVINAFKSWKTPKAKFATKAQKFNLLETKQCIKFIISKGWHKKLLTN